MPTLTPDPTSVPDNSNIGENNSWVKITNDINRPLYAKLVYNVGGSGSSFTSIDYTDEAFYSSTIPSIGQQYIATQDRKMLIYIGTTNENVLSVKINGVTTEGWTFLNGTYYNQGLDSSGSRSIYVNDSDTTCYLIYNSDTGRFEVRNTEDPNEEGSELYLYTNTNSYTYPWAFELTWYFILDGEPINLSFETWNVAAKESWLIFALDEEVQNGYQTISLEGSDTKNIIIDVNKGKMVNLDLSSYEGTNVYINFNNAKIGNVFYLKCIYGEINHVDLEIDIYNGLQPGGISNGTITPSQIGSVRDLISIIFDDYNYLIINKNNNI